MKYKCMFEFEGVMHSTTVSNLVMVSGGFFVDSGLEFTMDKDKSCYWIPTARICYVKLEAD